MSNQQSTVEFGLRAVQFSRLTRRGILLGLSLPQLIVLAIGVLSIVGALYAGGGILLAWTAPIWLLSAALAWTPVGGRKLIEWVPVTFRWVARTQARQTVFRRRIVKPRPAGTLALPGDAAALREWEDPETGAAMIHDPHHQTLTAIVGVLGAWAAAMIVLALDAVDAISNSVIGTMCLEFLGHLGQIDMARPVAATEIGSQ